MTEENISSKTSKLKSLDVLIIKKDGTEEKYDIEKVIKAINKSAIRTMTKFTDDELYNICKTVNKKVKALGDKKIEVATMHNIVESALQEIKPEVAVSYRDYRNYKKDFVAMLDKVYQESQRIMYLGDKENSNVDSTLVSTKRSLVYNELSRELYKKFFLNKDELQAIKDGYIYIHDMSARLNTMNCCLFDVASVLKGGFEMGNIWYNEPKSLDVAFDVIGDIVMSASAQQYGGFTVPEVDKILDPYAEKSFENYYNEFVEAGATEDKAKEQALKKVEKDFKQGFQGWEYKFNTVASSRGDYPFITVTSGLSTTEYGKMCNKVMLRVRMNGQGKKGNKKPVLFPKIVFLYDEELHSKDGILRDVYNAGIECSKKAMYPDWLSLTGEGYVASMYKKYKKVVSPMGSVDGKSVINYKYNDTIYQSTFDFLWNMMSKKYSVEEQVETKTNKGLYIKPENLQIMDSSNGGFVDVKFITKNYCNDWKIITLKNGYKLICTSDHPLQTDEGRKLLKDFSEEQKVYCVSQGEVELQEIESIENYDKADSIGFDVTTETDKFDVNNICSHNCRAFLSPWYERGGTHPADENDIPVFVGRFNIGAISLHLPMILAKSRKESRYFYEVLDYYLDMVRNLHRRTYDYLAEMKASINPLGFCEGGFLGGHLKYNEKIEPVLKSSTASFGITALNELQRLYNGKSLAEDGAFALEVMQYINDKVAEYKKQDNYLYALYGVPAENLCGVQVKQFRQKYGIVKNVSDRAYVSNSFHCHVSEDITPIQKQDLEGRFWDLMNGGKIQYVKYPIDYNTEAVETLVDRAMEKGFYEGVNLSLSYCNNCGHEELNMEVCPKCGSKDLTKIERMNGYLSYSRVKGDTRLNEAKMAEIQDRKSM